jgi:hypothetical protein
MMQCPRVSEQQQQFRYRVRLFAVPENATELLLHEGYNVKTIEKQLHPIITSSMEITFTPPQVVSTNAVSAMAMLEHPVESIITPSMVVQDISQNGPPSGPHFFDLTHDVMN